MALLPWLYVQDWIVQLRFTNDFFHRPFYAPFSPSLRECLPLKLDPLLVRVSYFQTVCQLFASPSFSKKPPDRQPDARAAVYFFPLPLRPLMIALVLRCFF